MNRKEIMASIVTAMVVVTIFAAMIGPASAMGYQTEKSTLDGPGGNVDNSLEYRPGQQVNYTVYFIPTTENCHLTSVIDELPDGSTEDLMEIGDTAEVDGLSVTFDASNYTYYPLDQGQMIVWELQWTIPTDWDEDVILNMVTLHADDKDGTNFPFAAPKQSNIITDVTFNILDPAAIGCKEMEFTGESTGHVAWHRWDFNNDGTFDTGMISGRPEDDAVTRSYIYATCGYNTVRLYGQSPFGDEGETVKTIYVACKPTDIVVGASPSGCVNAPTTVDFSMISLVNDTPIDKYEWVFTNGVSGSGVLPWPSNGDPTITRTIPAIGTKATLKVSDDLGCVGEGFVIIRACSTPPYKPPSDVPILTPTGMVALIGMLCIVGAGRILTKGRRS